ncbi:MAG: fsr 2 [Massilibacillus sp.]|jgi:FSR family fosmidomycin resistance protein-like MFS transporter|nr:fsr 2 [Massilibacillus sp.]
MMKQKLRHSWYAVTLLTTGHFFSDFYANFLPALLPIIMPKLGLSLTMSGLLVMILSFTSNVLQPFFGYIMDKRSLNWLLLFTVPGSAIFICLTGLADTKITLFILVALSGLAVSVFHPLGSSLVGKVASANKLGLSISIFVAGGNLGFALSPVIIVYFTENYGLSALPLLMIPSLILAVALYQSGLGKPRINSITSAENSSHLTKISEQIDLIKLNLAMGLRAWTHVSVTTFLPVLLVSRGHSATFAGVMLTIFLIGAALGGLYGGYLSDKLGCKKVIIASLALGIIPTYVFLSSLEISWWTWIVLFFCGAGLQGSAPSSLVWAQKLLPNNAGMASGMMLGLSFGLGGIGAAITGALADSITLATSLLLTTIPLALAALITATIPEKTMH